jgi:hypothetical protein
MNPLPSCKCLHCRAFFVPCPNHRATQQYCAQPECRKASKAAAQARWHQQAQNRAYFRGPEHVERVRRWRARHPGYWRKKAPARPPPAAPALQDFASHQAPPARATYDGAGWPAGGPNACPAASGRCVTRSCRGPSASAGGGCVLAAGRCVTRSVCRTDPPARRSGQARVGRRALRRLKA